MSKEMNLLYVKDNYGELFKETFNKESDITDIYDLTYASAKNMCIEDLVSEIKRVEKEMAYITENAEKDRRVAHSLINWCTGLCSNLLYVIDGKE